jgi:hypothetical protein
MDKNKGVPCTASASPPAKHLANRLPLCSYDHSLITLCNRCPVCRVVSSTYSNKHTSLQDLSIISRNRSRLP